MAATQDRATQIEHAAYTKANNEQDAREHIDAALGQLRSMVDEIEREAQRPENSLEQVLRVMRHQLAWKYANISSALDNADGALREALVAKTKLDVLSALPEA